MAKRCEQLIAIRLGIVITVAAAVMVLTPSSHTASNSTRQSTPAPQANSTTKQSGSNGPSSNGPGANGNDAQLTAKIVAFLRNLYAWDSSYDVKLGPMKESVVPEFYEVPITITYQGQSESGTIYASKDAKYVLRGDLFRAADDPFAENRALLAANLKDSPSMGPANAKVTIVEFSDFECPHCRLLYQSLKTLLPKYPQVRVVFKNFPIESIHPWAMTAAIAGRCAYQGNPDSFWKMYDSVFDEQEVISPENVYDKLTSFASQDGLATDAFHGCLSSPGAKAAVQADLDLGQKLDISSTPTIFVNGRKLVGGDPALLEQLISYETRH
jgi:protein-disulfide isomerase